MLLSEYLCGQMGGGEDHRVQAGIVRLIVAGNAMCNPMDNAGQNVDVLKKMGASPPLSKWNGQLLH